MNENEYERGLPPDMRMLTALFNQRMTQLEKIIDQRMSAFERQIGDLDARMRQGLDDRLQAYVRKDGPQHMRLMEAAVLLEQRLDDHGKRLDAVEETTNDLSLASVGTKGFTKTFGAIGIPVLVIVLAALLAAFSGLFHLGLNQQVNVPISAPITQAGRR